MLTDQKDTANKRVIMMTATWSTVHVDVFQYIMMDVPAHLVQDIVGRG